MPWVIKRTDTFLKHLKEHKNHHELLRELDKKLQRLQENPEIIGGMLSGSLHGCRSTRLIGTFRLIFMIDAPTETVHLLALDHRGSVYG